MPHPKVDQTPVEDLPAELVTAQPHLKRLTPKQALFAIEYVRGGFNATHAARLAGYKGDDNVLATIGWDNLRKLDVREAIKAEVRSVADAIGWTKDHAILVMQRILMSAIDDEAWGAAINAWSKLGEVTGVIDELSDGKLTISFHSAAAADDDPARLNNGDVIDQLDRPPRV